MKKNTAATTKTTWTRTYEYQGRIIIALYDKNGLIGRFDGETEGYALSYWAGDNWDEFNH